MIIMYSLDILLNAFYIFYLPRPLHACCKVIISTVSVECIRLQVKENSTQNVFNNKWIHYLVQSCGQISELVDSVAQHCQDPHPTPASYFYHTAVIGVSCTCRLVGDGCESSRRHRRVQVFSEKNEWSLSTPMILSLRSEESFWKNLLKTSFCGSLARVVLHALLEPIIGKRN